MDAGFDAARDVIFGLYTPILETVDPATLGKDAKTLLQEYLQSHKLALPKYTVIATQGEAHAQVFQVECAIAQLKVTTRGEGTSRRIAEQMAANAAYQKLISQAA